MSSVEHIFGGPTYERVPNETCIKVIEEWLEMARADLVDIARD